MSAWLWPAIGQLDTTEAESLGESLSIHCCGTRWVSPLEGYPPGPAGPSEVAAKIVARHFTVRVLCQFRLRERMERHTTRLRFQRVMLR